MRLDGDILANWLVGRRFRDSRGGVSTQKHPRPRTAAPLQNREFYDNQVTILVFLRVEIQ